MFNLICNRCERPFRGDEYSVVTDPWGGNREIICDACQERAYDRHQESLMESGPGPSLLDQQREATKLK